MNAGVARHRLAAEPPDPEEMDTVLKDIEQASLRVDATITSVRSLFRSASDPSWLQIEDAARQVLRLMQHDLQVHQISAASVQTDHSHTIAGDRAQLQQAVLNIVKNAIESMASKPADQRKLTVLTRVQEPWIVLNIRDTGAGIPQRANIFDAFFTTKADGMGLGLAICRTILDRHGGEIVLVATGDQGTEFEVKLPISSELSLKAN